jgi:hypothetical protein
MQMSCCAEFRKLVWIVVVVFAMAGTVQAYEVARVTTSGLIDVYREGKLVQVLRESAPLPKGALLKARGRCGVQLENMYLAAEDGSEFSVYNDGTSVQMDLNKGAIYFAVNQTMVELLVQTPGKGGEMQPVQIKPGVNGVLKGFVDVNGKATTVGVIEGGNITLSTPDGEKVITAGNQVTIFNEDDDDAPAAAGKINTKYLIGGGLAALAIAAAALALGGSSSSSSSPTPVSPATP